jgi:hypothetical protein
VKAAWADPLSRPTTNTRTAERTNIMLPARLTWKDQRGSTRFASVITRDVSEFGVFVECQSPISISKFRLVHFQLERDVRDIDGLPDSLRQGRLLSAVYRIHAPTRTGGRQGLALRLMVDPRRRPQAERADTLVESAPLELVAAAASVAEETLVAL